MKILAILGSLLLAITTIAAPFAIIGAFIVALNFIPWLLWNHAVAPTFGWPHATFWQVFFICWAASIASRILFGSRK